MSFKSPIINIEIQKIYTSKESNSGSYFEKVVCETKNSKEVTETGRFVVSFKSRH